jgi:hypothetical protein
MLHEFAVDPVALSNWPSFRYITEKFGVSYGRLMSCFPKTWKKMVYEACYGCQPIEKKRIEERLKHIDDRLLPSNRAYEISRSWLDNAETQQATSRPFHAIISTENPRSRPDVLITDELNETAPLWDVPREGRILRNAQALAACVRPLLQASCEVLFIDPYFDPSKHRYRRTLQYFFQALDGNHRIQRIEYHLDGNRLAANFFCHSCSSLSRILPDGRHIRLIRWSQTSGGEALHARYILTDIGGIRVEHGLDEGEPGETTDVSLLDNSLYIQRWKNYHRRSEWTGNDPESDPALEAFKFCDEVTI